MNREMIESFLSACEQDPVLQDFARNRSLSLYYRLSNPDLDFFTVFAGGEVSAGFGRPEQRPDMTLQMSAEIFDGIMSGRIGAMEAAMSGRMRFSGDTMKAMAAQRIQNDLIRLYTAASQAG